MGLFFISELGYTENLVADPTEPMDFAIIRDPRDEKKGSSDEELILNAIKFSKSESLAIINQKVVKVGDKVGANIIIKIDELQVRIKGTKGEKVLRLLEEPIKEVSS
ncbi:MAG: hypothetical protein JWM09_972 [Francisellaceae bacterium]|nr:hypothetical protein [Francisellaceae bacterium]